MNPGQGAAPAGAAPTPLPQRRWRRDLGLVALAALAVYGLSVGFELHERVGRWLARYESWQLDELPLALGVLACGMAWYAFRRRRDALAEAARREQAEAQARALLAHNRELAQGLIALQENERQALARELHDEFGQRCSAIRAETAWLRRSAGDDPVDRAGLLAAAQRADTAAQGLYQLVRDLLRRLRPADLDALGLVAALQALCESWEERSGIGCTFHHGGIEGTLGDTVDIAVYRVAQEALTNVMRHARAGQVSVRLMREGDSLLLSVQDDGRGMDVGAPSRGLGLLGATERAAAIGGTLDIDSRLGRGARLTLRAAAAGSAGLAGGRMISVLLADDHPVVRSGYHRLLDQAGDLRVVGEAGDTDAAYAAFAEHRPDVLVTDLSMPGGGGLELIRRVLARAPVARVLVFSMHDSALLVRRALDAGARGYLTKASPPEALVDAVRALHAGQRHLDPALPAELLRHSGVDEARRLSELSAREFAVFRLLAQGHTPSECAEALKLSAKTVSNHQTTIKEKLGVATSAALVHLAIRHGVVTTAGA